RQTRTPAPRKEFDRCSAFALLYFWGEGALPTVRSHSLEGIVKMHRWLPVLLAALWSAADARAALIEAQSGFNDATGINSDAAQNSPFTLGQTVNGRGAGEPGW